MARPFQRQTLDAAAATGPGSDYGTKGHNTLGLFVVAHGLDAANDTLSVRLEVGLETTEANDNEDEFAPVYGSDGTLEGELTVADFEDVNGDGTYAAFLYDHGVVAPRVRANITAFTDASNSGTTPTADLSVDAYVMATNRSGSGKDFTVP